MSGEARQTEVVKKTPGLPVVSHVLSGLEFCTDYNLKIQPLYPGMDNLESKMVAFRTAVSGTPSDGFWSEGDSVGIARVGKGYFAMTKGSLNKEVQTQMPGGQYTNIIDGSKVDVAQDGSATISIDNPEGIFAICVGCDGTSPPTPPTPRPTEHPTVH